MLNDVHRASVPFLRRPVRQPRFMAAVPFLVILAEIVYYSVKYGAVVAALVMAVALLVTVAIGAVAGDKLKPVPPLPEGYVCPMWVIVIAYPSYALFFLSVVAQSI